MLQHVQTLCLVRTSHIPRLGHSVEVRACYPSGSVGEKNHFRWAVFWKNKNGQLIQNYGPVRQLDKGIYMGAVPLTKTGWILSLLPTPFQGVMGKKIGFC